MVTFKVGDMVRLTPEYRAKRLGKNPNDFMAHQESVEVVRISDDYTTIQVYPDQDQIGLSWLPHAFEYADQGVPW